MKDHDENKLTVEEVHDKVMWLWLAAVLQTMSIALILVTVSCTARAEMPVIVSAVEDASEIYGVDPKLVLAIIEVESTFRPDAMGSLGEVGLMQLRPEFHPEVNTDIYQNVFMGVAYLSYVLKRCARFGKAAFVCYNVGPYRRDIEKPQETTYYRRVMAAYGRGV